ncbi:MAG: YdgA family protein [Gammaproteobacteria bacterium]|nr:YdgA family protein [Gammaproteobacteria bacterium]
MKKALIVVLLFAVIALGLPVVDGFWVQKKYYRLMTLVNQRTPMTVEIIDYHHGWFSSTATLQISATALKKNTASESPLQNNYQFILKEKLYHGPIIYRSSNPADTFGKYLTWALALSEIKVNQPDLKLNTLAIYHYNGNVDFRFECPSLVYPTGNLNETYNIEKLIGTFKLSKRFKHSQGKISAASVDIPLKDGHQIIKNVSYDFTLDKNAFDFWQGLRAIKIDDAILSAGDKIQLKNIALSLIDHTKSHYLRSTLNAKIDSFKFNDADYGKQNLVFTVSNLNLESLGELGQKADLLDQENASLPSKALELTPLVLRLLSDGFNLNLSSIDLNTKWGAISGNASLDISKQEHSHTQFFSVLNSTTGKADFIFPAKLLQEMLESRYQSLVTTQQKNETSPAALVKENIDRWILAGWLIPQGDNYQVNFVYKMNQLLLNGKPMKIPNLPIPDFQSTNSNR